MSVVLLRMAKWACVRKDFADIKIDNIMQNWESVEDGSPKGHSKKKKKMGALKKKKKVSWCTPVSGVGRRWWHFKKS